MFFPIKPVKTSDAKPAFHQVLEMINLGSRLVITPTDYAIYKLYQRGKGLQDAMQFLSGPRAEPIHTALNPAPQMLEDKIDYDAHYKALGLPVPPIRAIIGDPGKPTSYPQLRNKEEIVDFISACLNHDEHIVLKKVDGIQGSGVLVIIDLLEVEGRKFLFLSNGTTKQLDEVVKEIIDSAGVWLLQKRLTQHEVLNSLNPTSLNTIRVGTFLNKDGSVDMDFAVLRIGREYSQIDAYNHGGVAVHIDTQTGSLAEQGHQNPKFSYAPITEHPDSKVRFSNVRIPFWDEVINLAQSFAANAGGNRFIGWDVAITPTGPVFVEGNHNWDAHLAQVGGVGLLTNEFIVRLHREAGIQLNSSKLPKPVPLRAFQLLRS